MAGDHQKINTLMMKDIIHITTNDLFTVPNPFSMFVMVESW